MDITSEGRFCAVGGKEGNILILGIDKDQN